jgi:prepilin-type processing-associated H-X9-DG protein
LLLPSLSKAKETAARISCAGNMRQSFSVLMMYAGESGDWIPNGVSYVTLSAMPHDFWSALAINAYSGSAASYWKMVRCPYAPKLGLGPANLASTNDDYTLGLRYYLKTSNSDAYMNVATGKSSPKNLSELWTSASAYPLMADSKHLVGGVPMQFGSLSTGFVHLRHSGGTNLLYIDGHGEWRGQQQLAAGAYGPSFGVSTE